MTTTANELGLLAADLFNAKRMKAELNEELSKVDKDIREIELKLLAEMKEQNLHQIANDLGTIYISRQLVPKVVNWDAFYEYIQENGYFHMLERRPSRTAFREQIELGLSVPGVDPVEFDEVRTRKS
jgi:hypothetical protein